MCCRGTLESSLEQMTNKKNIRISAHIFANCSRLITEIESWHDTSFVATGEDKVSIVITLGFHQMFCWIACVCLCESNGIPHTEVLLNKWYDWQCTTFYFAIWMAINETDQYGLHDNPAVFTSVLTTVFNWLVTRITGAEQVSRLSWIKTKPTVFVPIDHVWNRPRRLRPRRMNLL